MPEYRTVEIDEDCQQLFKGTDAYGKHLANETFTRGIELDEDEEHATLRLVDRRG